MIPFDERLRRSRARRSSSTTCWSSALAARRTCRWARTSASATAPPATRRCWPPTGGSRRAWCRWSRSRARSSPPATSAGWSWPARSSSRARFLGAPFQLRGEVVARRPSAGATLGFPTANIVPDEALVCPGHGVYVGPHGGRRLRRGQRRRAARRSGPGGRCWSRPTCSTRDVDLYGRDADGSSSSAGCAASGGSTPSRR